MCRYNTKSFQPIEHRTPPMTLHKCVHHWPFVTFADQASHGHARKRRALSCLLSLKLRDRIARKSIFSSIPPISIENPFEAAVHHLDTYNVPHHDVRRFSSRDKRMSYVLCLQLLLTAGAGCVAINILPDDVLLHLFYFCLRSWDTRRAHGYMPVAVRHSRVYSTI